MSRRGDKRLSPTRTRQVAQVEPCPCRGRKQVHAQRNKFRSPESNACHGQKPRSPKMAAVGKRPVALIAAACVQPPAAVPVAAPPAPAGQTRIWFHRPYEPFESLNLANINVNGNLFGAVANGSAVYRDVPPRHYHIAPESFGQDFNHDKDVDLAPGRQLYAPLPYSRFCDF
jgi:hypothetical protein